MTRSPDACEICLGSFVDQHRTERSASSYLKHFTLLMKKYSAPGTALEPFCFLWSWHVLPKDQDEFWAPEDYLVSY